MHEECEQLALNFIRKKNSFKANFKISLLLEQNNKRIDIFYY